MAFLFVKVLLLSMIHKMTTLFPTWNMFLKLQNTYLELELSVGIQDVN